MKKIFTIVLSITMVGAASAQTISPTAAAQKAADLFLTANAAKGLKANAAEPKLVYTSVNNGVTSYYAFNNPQGGYAIIGGDEVAREVLAYSDNGSFDTSNMAPGAKAMLAWYDQQIAAAKKFGATENSITAAGTKNIKPICWTEWTQNPPYNDMCPMTKNTKGKMERCATGCVATAAAQAIATIELPYYGSRSKTTTHEVTRDDNNQKWYKDTTIVYNKNEKIDWDNLTSYYDETSTEAEKKAVAFLMRTMGTISEMTYGPSSGATSQDLCRGLRNYFNINCKYKSRKGVSNANWESMVYAELAAGRPVIYGADDPINGGGHEFVIDGYRASDNLFHVNWGWGEGYDGYFVLSGTKTTTLHVTSQSTGGTSDEDGYYSSGHEMIYNLVYSTKKLAYEAEVDADDASLQQSNGSSSAKAKAASSIPNIYTENDLAINFGENGAKNTGEDAKFVWGIELEPVFDDEESAPEEYDSYLLSVSPDDNTFLEMKAGDIVYSYNVPLGDFEWGGTDGIPFAKYYVTPILFNDSDTGDEYVSDDDIVYVSMPRNWDAPMANFVEGAKPETTEVREVATSQKSSANAVKKIHKNRIVIEKNGKQYNAAGQEQ